VVYTFLHNNFIFCLFVTFKISSSIVIVITIIDIVIYIYYNHMVVGTIALECLCLFVCFVCLFASANFISGMWAAE
jgi:hypothetical protein